MRLFVAFDIADDIRGRIARFLDGVRGFAPDARWVRPESIHITLKFVGEKSEDELEKIKRTLEGITAHAFEVNIRGYGFFPGASAPRVFWVGVEAGAEMTSLAAMVDQRLASIDIPKEEHAFNPHLTLARGAGESRSRRKRTEDDASRGFQRLQEKLAALSTPEFGTMTAREFFLYRSQLSHGGSPYTKLGGFALR